MRLRGAHWWAFALTTLAYLGAEQVLAHRTGPALDDGWIYLSFARAFGEGDWFSYPGADGPAGAITAPLWSFVLALWMLVGGANPITAKLLGVLVFGFAIWATGRLARAATSDEALARIAQLCTALTPRVAWASMSGMEAGLGLALAALGLALHLERRDAPERRWVAAAFVLALAGWSRPESFVLLSIAALHRRRVASLGIAALFCGTFPAFHLFVYGYPLPLPFYAKAVPGAPLALLRSGAVAQALTASVAQVGKQFAAVLAMLGAALPFLVPGLLAGLATGRRARNGVPFLLCAGCAMVAARGLLGMQAPTFQQGRYFMQLWPIFVIAGLHGLQHARVDLRLLIGVAIVVLLGFGLDPALASSLAFDHIRRAPVQSAMHLALGLCWLPATAFTVLAVLGWRWSTRGDARATVPVTPICCCWLAIAVGFGAMRNAEGVRDTYAMNVAMAENVAREVPAGELVACHDLGALGWFARRPLLDLAGLASAEVAFAPRDVDGRVDVMAILERRHPRWLCLTDEMLDKLNPTRRLPSGLGAWTEVEAARVTSTENVTVLGDVYRLIRLEWVR